jgi:hypothetical protein
MIVVPVQRTRYRDRVFDEWAKTDPEAMLAYLESTSDLSEVLVGEAGFQALATSAPEKLFAVADRFAASQRTQAQTAAVDVLATLDPVAAFERVSAMPMTNERDVFIDTIAGRYAEQNPEAALAWATTLEPRSPTALGAVLSRIATTDARRAADLVIADILDPLAANRSDMLSVAAVLATPVDSGSDAIPQIADTLALHRDPRIRAQLDSLLLTWSRADADTAIAWALSHVDALRTSSAATMARYVADAAPELARQTLQSLPQELRRAWIDGVASGLAAKNPGEAQSWVLSLPTGPARDGGLTRVLQRAANNGSIETRLLDAYSSEDSRAQALSSVVAVLGSSNPDLAQRLISEYITDPQQRQSAERQLESARQRSRVSFPGIILQ